MVTRASLASGQRIKVRALMADGRLRTAQDVAESLGVGPRTARDRLQEVGCSAERSSGRWTFWFLERETQDEEDARDSMTQERLFAGGGL